MMSLVDCASFEVMRSRSIGAAFAFDAHFEENGFRLVGP
jgi:predicted nucleic acid-binding protein